MGFKFLLNNNTKSEIGCFRKLIGEISGKEESIIFIVDEGFSSTQLFLNTYKAFEKVVQTKKIVISGKKEPSYSDLNQYLEKAKVFSPDLIIGVGGGSAMDCAKAISVLLKNTDNPLNYRGFDQITKEGVELWLVPTNAGTGSEASYNASFVDNKSKKKMGINGNFMFAKKSFLDAETTLSCPKFSFLGSTVDAIVHSIEGYICKNSNVFSDMFAVKSLQLLISNFEYFFKNSFDNKIETEKDLEIRQQLLEGAYLAGIVQMNSGSGIAAAISYPLSVYHNVPHGIGGGIFLPHVLEFNLKNQLKKINELSKSLNYTTPENMVFNIKEMFLINGVPQNLSRFGLYRNNKNHIVEIMKTQQLAFDQNPILFRVEEEFVSFIDNFLE